MSMAGLRVIGQLTGKKLPESRVNQSANQSDRRQNKIHLFGRKGEYLSSTSQFWSFINMEFSSGEIKINQVQNVWLLLHGGG